MSEAATVSKPAKALQPSDNNGGNQYGTLVQRLRYWARHASHSQMRDTLLEAARELESKRER